MMYIHPDSRKRFRENVVGFIREMDRL